MIESILIVGLGGQGVVTLGDLLAEHAWQQGLKVSLFHSKGMAQRGGRVVSEVRFSPDLNKGFGARIDAGQADVLLGLETGEAASSCSFLKEGGMAFLLNHAELNAQMRLKQAAYPSFAESMELFVSRKAVVCGVEHPVPPLNMCLLGAFAALAPARDSSLTLFSGDNLQPVITARFSRGLEENMRSFRQGYACGQERQGSL